MHGEPSGTWAGGQHPERCGELIDTGHATMHALAERFRLRLVDLEEGEPDALDEADRPSSASERHDLDRVWAGARTGMWRRRGLPDHVGDIHGACPHAGPHEPRGVARRPGSRRPRLTCRSPVLERCYTNEYGADADEPSALNLIYLMGRQPTPASAASSAPRTSGTASQTAARCCRVPSLPVCPAAAIRLEHPLERVVQDAGRVRLHLRDARGRGRGRCRPGRPGAAVRRSCWGVDCRDAQFDELKQRAIREAWQGRQHEASPAVQPAVMEPVARWPCGRNADAADHSLWEPTRGQPGAEGILRRLSRRVRGEPDQSRRRRTQIRRGDPAVRAEAQRVLRWLGAGTFRTSRGPGPAGRRSRGRRAIPSSGWLTPTGASASTSSSRWVRARAGRNGASTSPGNTAPSIPRVSWRAAAAEGVRAGSEVADAVDASSSAVPLTRLARPVAATRRAASCAHARARAGVAHSDPSRDSSDRAKSPASTR